MNGVSFIGPSTPWCGLEMCIRSHVAPGARMAKFDRCLQLIRLRRDGWVRSRGELSFLIVFRIGCLQVGGLKVM